ncbi:MAG: hypothetical protein IJ654_10990 [Bacteroidales bacterium]|nr:hypothetical protein [Bacteroidales bacterium]MBR1576955.1 hypothetical protein [Bacteroidales bacterium]
MDRRTFLSTAALAATAVATQTPLPAAPARKRTQEAGLSIRFLGTGAADWNGPDARGEHRRNASVLVERSFLIDFTSSARDMLPDGVWPEVIFYTHSHRDHYEPAAALEAGVRQVYLNPTILLKAREDFREAAGKTGLPMPVITTLGPGASARVGDVVVTALPANHFVSFAEQTQIYLLEKEGARLLYATDTGGIPAMAARLAGIDAHRDGEALTALIMEATMGLGHEDDYRIFSHSSVGTVLQTLRVLTETGRYAAPEGQRVYLTHLARTLHGTQAELDATLPAPLRAAYDGLEVTFRK